MKLRKCINGHYYDSDKFVECPNCVNQKAAFDDDALGIGQAKIDTKSPKASEKKEYPRLIKPRTAGWLVCVNGEMQGESFALREGDNRIGRSSNMDVVLFKEASVSKENHAVVTYNGDGLFLLKAPDNTAAVKRNGRALKGEEKLVTRDRIQLGDCVLLFVALCGDDFEWDKFDRS